MNRHETLLDMGEFAASNPALTNDLPIGTKLVLLDIDRVKFCPYCGHVMKIEYSRNGEALQTYKTCNVAECDLKMVVT